ncbi:DUF4405 domain-containing protein [Frateuria aurantia]
MPAKTTPSKRSRPGQSASQLMHRFATPFTTGLFVISVVSGVALFFHWASSAFHSMHVWLSMVLLVPFFLHLWKNWRALVAYARRRILFIPLLICFVTALPFAYSGLSGGGGRGGNPGFQLMAMMAHASLAELAPLLKASPQALQTRLQHQGFQVDGTDETLDAIAASSHRESSDVVRALLPKGGHRQGPDDLTHAASPGHDRPQQAGIPGSDGRDGQGGDQPHGNGSSHGRLHRAGPHPDESSPVDAASSSSDGQPPPQPAG